MTERLPDAAFAQLFGDARTHNAWRERDVPDALLHELVALTELGPTSANCSPARFIFVKSQEAKTRLNPFLSEGNREKLERHFDHINNVHVILNVQKLQQIAEAKLNVNGGEVFATHEHENMYAAIDGLIDKLDRQVIKHKEKLTRH